jgi:UDP-N-acetyl-2-amino-2-deoxyglucuronate dehydrogenase
MIRFGILGCGSAAIPVAQAMTSSPEAGLEMVFDLDSNLAGELASRFGVKTAHSLADLLSNPLVDAVYIAVPHDLLHPLTLQSLGSGKHVLVEKPMALTIAQADEMVHLAEAQRRVLGVYYEMRFAGSCLAARRLVQEGAIGEIIGVRIQTQIDKPLSYWQMGYTGRKVSPWRGQRARSGGGVLLMNTSHLLEAVRYITGLEIERVTGETATLVAPVEVEDMAAATLVYKNGAIGSILAGAHLAGARTGDECFDLYGSRGQLRVPDPYGTGTLQVFLRETWEDLPGGSWHSLPVPPIDVHCTAINEFAQAVGHGTQPPTAGSDAIQVLAAIRAIYFSSIEHRAVLISEVRDIELENV